MKGLQDALNLPAKIIEPKLEDVVPVKEQPEYDTTDRDADFDHARENMRDLIKKGDEALDGVLELARLGDHPRAYEVAGQIIKTMSEVNKDLLGLHKQKNDMDGIGGKNSGPQNVTNAVFVGTTADLQKMMKERKKIDNAEQS